MRAIWRWFVGLFRRPAPVPSPVPPIVIGKPEIITPKPCAIPPDGPGWTPVEPQPPALMTPAVRAAMDSLGPAPGPTPEASLEALAACLRRSTVCAGRQSDGLMVKRPDGLYEEHHAVAFGTGQWIATPFRGVWRYEL